MNNQVSIDNSQAIKNTKSNSLFTVFKYVAIGSGILGLGFLIAIAGFLLNH